MSWFDASYVVQRSHDLRCKSGWHVMSFAVRPFAQGLSPRMAVHTSFDHYDCNARVQGFLDYRRAFRQPRLRVPNIALTTSGNHALCCKPKAIAENAHWYRYAYSVLKCLLEGQSIIIALVEKGCTRSVGVTNSKSIGNRGNRLIENYDRVTKRLESCVVTKPGVVVFVTITRQYCGIGYAINSRYTTEFLPRAIRPYPVVGTVKCPAISREKYRNRFVDWSYWRVRPSAAHHKYGAQKRCAFVHDITLQSLSVACAGRRETASRRIGTDNGLDNCFRDYLHVVPCANMEH